MDVAPTCAGLLPSSLAAGAPHPRRRACCTPLRMPPTLRPSALCLASFAWLYARPSLAVVVIGRRLRSGGQAGALGRQLRSRCTCALL